MVLLDGNGSGHPREVDELAVGIDTASMARVGLEQSSADSDGDKAEHAGALAEPDDPVMEGFVHHLELELDDPRIVAVEDGEGFRADKARDGG